MVVRRGFRSLSEVSVGSLALPERQRRRLGVRQAWSRAAGPAVARRVVADGLRRGVLELTVEDARWAAQLESILPSLVGRVAGHFPHLGVRSYRLTVAGRRADGKPRRVEPSLEPLRDVAPGAPPKTPTAPSDGPATGPRLERIVRRYLARRRAR